ncbi:MAG: hypothetical protein ABJC61_12505, partial [Acidobacteriota bacterium]
PDASDEAASVREALVRRGAMFFQELAREAKLSASLAEDGLGRLIALGQVTCDSFSGLRWLIVPAWRRKAVGLSAGRWSALRPPAPAAVTESRFSPVQAEFVARRMLARTGVVFRRTLAREKQPIPWRDLARALRTLEARGEIRGGRFVAGFDGEQYALPEAVTLLRELRRKGESSGAEPVLVSAADPLNLRGILTPDDRISPLARRQVQVA